MGNWVLNFKVPLKVQSLISKRNIKMESLSLSFKSNDWMDRDYEKIALYSDIIIKT